MVVRINLPNDDEDTPFFHDSAASTLPPSLPENLAKSEWTASAGLQYQQISIRDGDGDLSPEDELGNELSFSGEAKTIYSPARRVRDRRKPSANH